MAKVNTKLTAQIRDIKGRKVKQLRRDGVLPATVYGHKFEPISVQIIEKDLIKTYDHAGESGLVDLIVGENSYPILFRNPQYHPLWGNLMHIDCYKVNLKEKISTYVPLEMIGESSGVKAGLILVPVTDEIEVEALPTDLPEKIEVDISKLENVDSVITVADLVVDTAKVEIKTALDQVIVKLEEAKEEVEEVAEETVAPGDVPATNQKTEEEKAAAEAAKKEEN